MYKILANDKMEFAIFQKEGSEQLYFIFGPRMVPDGYMREENADPVSQNEYNGNLGKYCTRHNPPIEVKDLRDWPEAVQARLKQSCAA